ncbi:hypothetical protein DSM112329_03126 [Paraconexibacter sp. AEG42_29]|uniref:Uncharacterized protein n=1 Tax=Paraconexibacter sp. AEG42_29 TaxID=2997339 RepID=A0AAU7AXB3_9ACTN
MKRTVLIGLLAFAAAAISPQAASAAGCAGDISGVAQEFRKVYVSGGVTCAQGKKVAKYYFSRLGSNPNPRKPRKTLTYSCKLQKELVCTKGGKRITTKITSAPLDRRR